MEMLLGFAPFIIFAVLANTVSPTVALVIGTLAAIVIAARTFMRIGTFRILEVGSAILMGLVALYTLAVGGDTSLLTVKLWVDAGLLVIALASMALQTPFTIQYAKEHVDPKYWSSPTFIAKNYKITGVWACIFALNVIVEALMLNAVLPQHLGFIIVIAAFVVGFRYTAQTSKVEVHA